MFRASKRWRRTHVRSRGQAAWTKSRPRPRQRCGCRRASLRRNRTQRAATLAVCGAVHTCAARLVGGSTAGRQQQGWSASAGRRDSSGSKTKTTTGRPFVHAARAVCVPFARALSRSMFKLACRVTSSGSRPLAAATTPRSCKLLTVGGGGGTRRIARATTSHPSRVLKSVHKVAPC